MELAPIEIIEDSASFPAYDLAPLSLEVKCNTPGDITRQNVLSAVQRGYPVVSAGPALDVRAILVGGGPSLKKNWHEIKLWQQSGAHIFALNGAVKFLNEKGIRPNVQVMIDPRADNTKLIGDAAVYLMASQCSPELLDALPNDRTALFHCLGSTLASGDAVLSDGSVKSIVDGVLIGGNVSVGLCAMCLVFTMGYRQINLYGYDSSYEDGAHHAYDQDQTPQEQKTLEVTVFDKSGERRVFQTNYAMAKQAELFPETARMLLEADAVINVHGEGLIPTMAQALCRTEEK